MALRADFNRAFPHIYPGDDDEPVFPCVYEGELTELIHQGQGINALMNQTSVWLARAAADDLIDPSQGWEPTRRDTVKGEIVFEAEDLRAVITPQAGTRLVRCRALIMEQPVVAMIGSPLEFFKDALAVVRESRFRDLGDRSRVLSGCALIVWADESDGAGGKLVHDQYLPETVSDLGGLLERAATYGCTTDVQVKIGELYACLQPGGASPFRFVPIILCARRPFRLIGDRSNLELIPYVVEMQADSLGFLSNRSPVRPLGQRHAGSRRLFRRMSGLSEDLGDTPIGMLGCGSLGSKIAIHFARAGFGPFRVADAKRLGPHNMARHALIESRLELPREKASTLRDALLELGAQAEAFDGDILLALSAKPARVIPENAQLVVDATASLAVSEKLASLPDLRLPGRVGRVVLYGRGALGVLLVEGPDRNPRLDDLVAALYDESIENPRVRDALAGAQDNLTRQPVGYGCGSYTMVMPDTITSMHAAGMAQRLQQLLSQGFSPEGELWVGMRSTDELGVEWKRLDVPRVATVAAGPGCEWEVRILPAAVQSIFADAKKWGTYETGGVLIGSVSFARRCFTVARVLEAPEDSQRTPTLFVLGTKGLSSAVRQVQADSGNLLTYIGTWHSHPTGGGHSGLDRRTLAEVSKLRLGAPTVALLLTGGNFAAIATSLA